MPRRLRSRWLCALALVGGCAAHAIPAVAGGGPENVLLVVNSQSWASLTIANHWMQLRQIPPGNVVYLDWRATTETIQVERFRQEILTPVLNAISRRGLGNQIDYVIYSSDFPYAIDCQGDLGAVKLGGNLKPISSINGLTYLWQQVLSKDPNYMGLKTNGYMRVANAAQADKPTHAFRSWYGWGPEGQLLEAGGRQYLLSMMLGVTIGRGNSVSEVLRYLRRSAGADGTKPSGTIYFARNNDVRSTTRAPAFEAAVNALDKLNVQAQIITQQVPDNRRDVQGAMLGTPNFDWEKSESTILPGAICEHLTSSGGVMRDTGGQTPLSELLRHGAAAASGTVTEPMAIQDKFPFPFLHVHYARGATVAEAFYQAVYGPFQLLIVGDPLCRPWAWAPQITVENLRPGATLEGTVEIAPAATAEGDRAADRFELFVDGQRRNQCGVGETLRLDTTRYGDGHHELRIVAIESGPLESQGRLILPVKFNNHQQLARLIGVSEKVVGWNDTLKLTATCEGAERIVILHGSRVLGNVSGAKGEVSVSTRLLGLGPVRLHAVAVTGQGAQGLVTSAPLEFEIEPTPRLSGAAGATTFLSMRPGLKLLPEVGGSVEIRSTAARDWLEKAKAKGGKRYRLDAAFEADEDEVFQFQIRHAAPIKISVDGAVVFESAAVRDQRFVPFSVSRGMHQVRIDAKAPEDLRADLRFGGKGTWPLSDEHFRYVP